ncbi:hypothetical protein [Oxalobacter paraformigenes]|uniref:Uncharacterized protein n=1 Tax=Oxalobacter paraformigenes TaxID=556268 RepID=T5LQP2_9BURK|nr:hypothetical protein [Oxalobacter paraformigenes]EQM95260.1 hypothetical protein OFAG_02181 [Oxalobacter paraformigenes]
MTLAKCRARPETGEAAALFADPGFARLAGQMAFAGGRLAVTFA